MRECPIDVQSSIYVVMPSPSTTSLIGGTQQFILSEVASARRSLGSRSSVTLLGWLEEVEVEGALCLSPARGTGNGNGRGEGEREGSACMNAANLENASSRSDIRGS